MVAAVVAAIRRMPKLFIEYQAKVTIADKSPPTHRETQFRSGLEGCQIITLIGESAKVVAKLIQVKGNGCRVLSKQNFFEH